MQHMAATLARVLGATVVEVGPDLECFVVGHGRSHGGSADVRLVGQSTQRRDDDVVVGVGFGCHGRACYSKIRPVQVRTRKNLWEKIFLPDVTSQTSSCMV